mgnify:CR=1 FL=1
MTLDELAVECLTDKSSLGHDYAIIYEQYFDKIRQDHINLLEIGVAKGHSLKLWYNYFSNANIYAIDNDKDINHYQISSSKIYENDRTKIFIGDQANKIFIVNNLNGIYFDIIIDDGSHESTDQLASFEILFDFLKPGGVYIIEDLHCSTPSSEIRQFLKRRCDDLLDSDKVRYPIRDNKIKSISFYNALAVITKQ